MTLSKLEIPHGDWVPYPRSCMGDELIPAGSLLYAEEVHSPQLRNSRTVLVYLPPSYADSERRYPVFYMQDGQNLFDPVTSFAGDTWSVAQSMNVLAKEAIEAIVVGIYHAGKPRIREYNPFPTWKRGAGDRYLAFLIETVKPAIDRRFRTLPSRRHTAIAGSSMGGLISLYGFVRHPEVFGMAGVLSPSLWVANYAIYGVVREQARPGGRIYLDNGARETSARPMCMLLEEKGYRQEVDMKYVFAAHDGHTEAAWARRFPGMVRFLLHSGSWITDSEPIEH